ncbi:HAD family hydrolase [Pseudonocardia nematodicida]|uniref:HAD family hydrolase n=1 Tax=Pseudonocardia nematodicida TaxID=1206997 RepID=A0ABV1KCA7_9PSEU
MRSWRDGAARAAIEDFVARITGPGPDHVEREARVAVFDNDGTLWCEKPMPVQLDFTLRRLAEIAEATPGLAGHQPYRAAATGDLWWLGEAMTKHYRGDDTDLHVLGAAVTAAFGPVTVEEYDRLVADFFAEAKHPELGRLQRHCGYAPMVELVHYLEAHGFTCYVASGGDRDFVRHVADTLYGVPPERVVGGALGLRYRDTELVYKSEMDVFDDGRDKPVRIWSRIGRRPVLAVGNSNGDLPMLAWTGRSDGPALRLLLRHDDAEREYDYSAGAEDALARATGEGWPVISMRDDWTRVFA